MPSKSDSGDFDRDDICDLAEEVSEGKADPSNIRKLMEQFVRECAPDRQPSDAILAFMQEGIRRFLVGRRNWPLAACLGIERPPRPGVRSLEETDSGRCIKIALEVLELRVLRGRPEAVAVDEIAAKYRCKPSTVRNYRRLFYWDANTLFLQSFDRRRRMTKAQYAAYRKITGRANKPPIRVSVHLWAQDSRFRKVNAELSAEVDARITEYSKN